MPARTVDAIVLGAGIVGVSAALALQARGRRVALVDRHREGGGRDELRQRRHHPDRGGASPMCFRARRARSRAAALNRDPRAHIRYGALPRSRRRIWRYFQASTPAGKDATARAMAPLLFAAAEPSTSSSRRRRAPTALLRSRRLDQGVPQRARARSMAHAGGRGAQAVSASARHCSTAPRWPRSSPMSARAAIGGVALRRSAVDAPIREALVRSYAALFVKRGGRMETGDALSLEPAGGGWMVKTDSGRLARPRRRHRARAVVRRTGPALRPPPAVLRQARLSHALRREGQRGPHPPGARPRARLSRRPRWRGA